MAALAVQSILPQMAVILLMTGAALLRHLDGPRRSAVAVRTLQLRMGAKQREMCLLAVIKTPKVPAVGRVTALALRPEPAAVHIVGLVAADTAAGRADESQ